MLFLLPLLYATVGRDISSIKMKDTLPTEDIKSDSEYMEKVENGQVTTSNLATA